jgi:hypothetical protein
MMRNQFSLRTACGLAVLMAVGCSQQVREARHPEGPDAQLAADKLLTTTAPATAPSAPAAKDGWRDLFDGKTLTDWKLSDFAGAPEPRIENGTLIVPNADALSGVTYTGGNLPKMNYEVSLDAMRVNGSDFFCGLTVPYNDSFVTLVIGGWGGGLVGISSLDGDDAAHNDSSSNQAFAPATWYHIRLAVSPTRLEAWIDDKQIVDVSTKDRKVGVRSDIEASTPMGLATYQTTAAYKNIRIRSVAARE